MYRLFKRKRSYLGLIVFVVLPILVTYALTQSEGFSQGSGEPLLASALINAYYVSLITLFVAIPLFVPALVVMVAGDLISGEISDGTLRMMLLRPVSRTTLVLAKLAMAAFYSLLLLAVLGITSVLVGGIGFGWGPMVSLSGALIPHAQAVLYLALAYLVAFALMMSVVGIAMFFSVATRSSLTAIGGTLALVIGFQILRFFDTFDFLTPYLFTSYFDSWLNLFRTPIYWTPIWQGVATSAGYAVPLLLAAIFIFRRQDILT
jgi:ABC-2 type transport system permease protein